MGTRGGVIPAPLAVSGSNPPPPSLSKSSSARWLLFTMVLHTVSKSLLMLCGPAALSQDRAAGLALSLATDRASAALLHGAHADLVLAAEGALADSAELACVAEERKRAHEALTDEHEALCERVCEHVDAIYPLLTHTHPPLPADPWSPLFPSHPSAFLTQHRTLTEAEAALRRDHEALAQVNESLRVEHSHMACERDELKTRLEATEQQRDTMRRELGTMQVYLARLVGTPGNIIMCRRTYD